MKQPQLTTPSDISLHEPLRRTLPNGVTIHTLCAAEFEVVRVSFVFRAGSAQQRKAFVATSTANLLSEGTRDMTSQQIAEQFDFYGSYFDVNVDRDYVYITFMFPVEIFPADARRRRTDPASPPLSRRGGRLLPRKAQAAAAHRAHRRSRPRPAKPSPARFSARNTPTE